LGFDFSGSGVASSSRKKPEKSVNSSLRGDGNGDFMPEMGMLVGKENLGFGKRSWRYSMYVENGVIEKMFVKEGFSDNCPTDPFEASDADTMLEYIKSRKADKAA
jgi:peroxiredoxin